MITTQDPNVLSVTRAAALIGVSSDRMRWRLKQDPDFRLAVVINMPGPVRISKPRLLKHLHGDDWRLLVAAGE